MALEDKTNSHAAVVDKFVTPVANGPITVRDYVVRPSAIGGAIWLALPPVNEAKGRFYSIIARAATAVNTITIIDNFGDSECWPGDIIMDGKCDRILMYSDGLAWHALGGGGVGQWPGFDTTPGPGTTQAPTSAAPTVPSTTTPAPQC